MKGQIFDTAIKPELAVLIAADLYSYRKGKCAEYLEELAFLALTAGAETVKIFTQKTDRPHSKTYLGQGKLEEVAAYIKENEIAVAIFDDELSPSQTRNLEDALVCKIIYESKEPISLKEIAGVAQKLGYKSDAKNFANNVYQAVNKLVKAKDLKQKRDNGEILYFAV